MCNFKHILQYKSPQYVLKASVRKCNSCAGLRYSFCRMNSFLLSRVGWALLCILWRCSCTILVCLQEHWPRFSLSIELKYKSMTALCLLIAEIMRSESASREDTRLLFHLTIWNRMFLFSSMLYTDSHIYELFCLCLPSRQTVPGWDPCRWGGWAVRIGAE